MQNDERLPVVRMVHEEMCIRIYLALPDATSGPLDSRRLAWSELPQFLKRHGVTRCVLDVSAMGGGA